MSNKQPIEFKVISGELKGRRIVSPNLGVTRPPLSRLRKSIFDFLAPSLPHANYLDLFSGTGSYLFEAVSRGVGGATGVEIEIELADSINRQATKFEIGDRLHCLRGDVLVMLEKLEEEFDIILMAPPQHKGLIGKALEEIHRHKVAAPKAMIICQHETNEMNEIDFPLFNVVQQRKYGNTTFTILRSD